MVLEPVVLEPVVLEPVVLEPVVLEPVVLDPVVLEPVVVDPVVVVEPVVVVDPVVVEPVVVELGAGRRLGSCPPDASDGVSAERSDAETCFRLDSADDPLSSLPPVAFPTANAPPNASSAATPSATLVPPAPTYSPLTFRGIRAPCSWPCSGWSLPGTCNHAS